MKNPALLKATLIGSLALLLVLPARLSAQATRGGGFFGDWRVTTDWNGRQSESILSFSRDSDGNRIGQWISFLALNEMKNVTFDAGKLSFERVGPNRNGGSFTSTFSGTIQEGKLSGTLFWVDRGEYETAGERMPRIPRVVGAWALKLKMGDREFTSTLILKADQEGALAAQWESERGEHTVSDVQYRQRQLTFKRKSKMQDREWESAFEGTVQGNTLAGTIKSERGELAVEGERVGGALIGTWMLDIASERGNRPQRLVVNGDMSGLYGPVPVKMVTLENDRVSFALTPQFGGQTYPDFKMDFAGKLEAGKLVGELTSRRGTQKVTGTKLIRTFGRRGNQ